MSCADAQETNAAARAREFGIEVQTVDQCRHELLANTTRSYTVTSPRMETAQINTESPSISVHGTTSGLPYDVTKRQRAASIVAKQDHRVQYSAPGR